MKIIIFAGGSGTRFWPASRKDNPKQFQEVIDNKPLVRLKFDYLRLGFDAKDIFLSTGIQYKSEVEKIFKELPKENFIYEKAMRDTGPAILFATDYVYKRYGDEVISLQWADHFIKKPETFVELLQKSEQIVSKENKTIVVGAPMRYASPHRGHIKNGEVFKSLDDDGDIKLANFRKFVEKPTLAVAKQYVKSGDYTWNTGYFVTKPSLVLEKYKNFAPEIYRCIVENDSKGFENLEKNSFDYIFAENLNKDEALVVIAKIGWSDVGEWISLKEALQNTQAQVVTKGNVINHESKDCLVYNYEGKELVATIGLEGLVVVNTKDVIAVFPKSRNGDIKILLKKMEKNSKLSKYL
jgi:mannose-1-phosphate guanylyltransferase